MSRRFQLIERYREKASYMLRHASDPKLLVLAEQSFPSGKFLTSTPIDTYLYFQFLWVDSRESTFDWEHSRPLYTFGIDSWRDNISLLQLLLLESLFTKVIDEVSFFCPGSRKRMIYTRESFTRFRSSPYYDEGFWDKSNQPQNGEDMKDPPTVLLPFEAAVGYHCQNNLPIEVKSYDNDGEYDDMNNDSFMEDTNNQIKAANKRISEKEKEALDLTTVVDNFLQQRPFRC